eukprot:9816664-Lingulodinium_polyedra.AAC.1
MERLPELELHIHLERQPRHLKTILYHQAHRSHNGVSQLSDGARKTNLESRVSGRQNRLPLRIADRGSGWCHHSATPSNTGPPGT